MSFRNCQEVDLDDLEDQMFAHLITEMEEGFTVKLDDGTIIIFDSFAEAKEFIFDGGLR